MGSKTFGTVDLGDRRRTQRLIDSAAAIAQRPEYALPLIFDWNELRGFYRLCHRPEATVAKLQQPHWDQTQQAMGPHPLVLILHDTSELDFTSHTALEGTGPIGDGRGRGFLRHNSLAVVPSPRQVLGLTHQQIVTRKECPESETASARRCREKESALWVRGIAAVGAPPAGCRWVDVGGRGADAYEVMRASREAGHDFLFRVCQDREVGLDAGMSRTVKLREFAASLPSLGEDTVPIPSRGGRASREARVRLGVSQIWLPAPSHSLRRTSQPVIAAWVIRVWEVDPPAGGEALEWLLVTSVPTTGVAEAMARRDWYACRWMVEEFHRIGKSGCGEEDRRFETADRMRACLAILPLVAVRVFHLRTALESAPEEPASTVATAAELGVLGEVRPTGKRLDTVRDFVLAVGRLGGHLGRKGDGPPGTRLLWTGYQRLQDLVLGYQARLRKLGKDVGNR